MELWLIYKKQESIMFKKSVLLGVVLVLFSQLSLYGKEKGLFYSNNFEKTDDLRFWVKDNSLKNGYTINFKGLTNERYYSGKKSLKIDITFTKSGKYFYMHSPALSPPPLVTNPLYLSGYLFIEKSSGLTIKLGWDMLFAGKFQANLWLPKINTKNGWLYFEQNLYDIIDEKNWNPNNNYFQGWYLHIAGNITPGKQIIVYLDDVNASRLPP
ncbi:MAG: hypothetical protein PHV82_10525 [Victivallaceae bacterium]|nr:hypothetical protein [Victivallaceae bacterium]